MPDFHGHRSLKPVNLQRLTLTHAETQRHDRSRGRKGPTWGERRNGLPVGQFYVYRGTGVDQYEHLYDEDEAAG